MLPRRYPFVPEFRRALELDSSNGELRRELAYLLLRMDLEPEAEVEFHVLTETAPNDLLAATQLGFLLYARGETIPPEAWSATQIMSAPAWICARANARVTAFKVARQACALSGSSLVDTRNSSIPIMW